MYEPTRSFLLRLLKVPPEPHAPIGDPASTRVFRAGRNYFKLQLFGWSVAQVAALIGIVFWAVVLLQVEAAAREQKMARATQPPPPPAGPTEVATQATAAATSAAASIAKKSRRHGNRIDGWAGFKQGLIEFALILPPWAFPLIWVLKVAGFTLYLVQIPVTYSLRRLDYEMRWYVVTDRSLRIRTGVWNVQELTMSFANLQQVVVTQGPVQRLLGLADVLVQSAGGGTVVHQHGKQQSSLHAGHFHGVDNASEIRDLILRRLKRFRETGLGDPDDTHAAHPPAAAHAADDALRAGANSSPALLAAARELRDEARALRAALG